MTENPQIAVCDAGPLIHLDELDSLHLLGNLRVYVPDAVEQEVRRHQPSALTALEFDLVRPTTSVQPALTALRSALALDEGEWQALLVLSDLPSALFLTDDAAARLAAQQLGYRVHGTLGVLLRAIRRGQMPAVEVLSRLRSIPDRSSLFIRPVLLDEIIRQVEQEHVLGRTE